MKWFSNLRTMTKMMIGCSVLVALMAGVGFVGVNDLGVVKTMMETLYNRHLIGLSAIKEANINLIYIGRGLREAILQTDRQLVQTAIQGVEQGITTMGQHLDHADTSIVTDDDKVKLAKARQLSGQYVAAVREVLALAEANRDAEALESLQRIRSLGTQADDAMSEAADTKEKLGKQAFAESEATYASTLKTMIWLVVGGALLGLTIGYVTARTTVGAIIATLDEVKGVSDGVAAAAGQLSAASQEIAGGAQEQAASLEETAASLEEITSTIKQNADNAQQAHQLASASREIAQKGGGVVGHAVNAMGEINEASKRIADIITTIDEIAFQTNLLALNAAVEAARAGEQGRGFAVVAAEVRNLAQRSATAAKEIKGLIQDSVRRVEAGSELVNKSGATLEEIVASVKRVTDIVTEIAAASREQSSGIEQVNKAVTQMDQVTQGNASQTEELSGTAESLSDQAVRLQDLVIQFKARELGRSAVEGRVATSAIDSRRAAAPAGIRASKPKRATAHQDGQGKTAAPASVVAHQAKADGEVKADAAGADWAEF
jgi:hypothetical protein